jgi:hypothetical protein
MKISQDVLTKFNEITKIDGEQGLSCKKEYEKLGELLNSGQVTEGNDKKFLQEQMDNFDLNNVYKNTEAKYGKAAEEIKKQQETEQKETLRKNIEEQIKECDVNNGSQLTKVLNLIKENSDIIDADEAIKTLFKDQLYDVETDRTGSKLYKLRNRTAIYYDKSILKSGEVTIKRPDGTYEQYNEKGEFLSNDEIDEIRDLDNRRDKLYDENKNVVGELDAYGNLLNEINRNPDGSVSSYVEYEYDANGNITNVVKKNPDGSVIEE